MPLFRSRIRARRRNVYAIIFGAVGGILIYSFGSPLIRLYCRDADASIISAGLTRMSYLMLPYFTCASMDVLNGMMRGMGKTVLSMIITLVGVCVVRVLWIAFIYPINPVPGMLYVSYPITWTLTSVVLVICLMKQLSKEKQKMQ